MPLLLLLLLLPLVLLALTPLMLVQRYRAGTARRLARPWVATFAVGAMLFSALFFLAGSVVTSLWVPNAFTGAATGVAIGCVLGAAGLLLTRWEPSPRTLHYTPNRWLVFVITFLVSARVLYGLWRSWAVVRAGAGDASAVAAFGVPESLAAGGIVIGYYLAYSAGLRWRIRRWQRRPLRPLT